jgi:hypothetical protein
MNHILKNIPDEDPQVKAVVAVPPTTINQAVKVAVENRIVESYLTSTRLPVNG